MPRRSLSLKGVKLKAPRAIMNSNRGNRLGTCRYTSTKQNVSRSNFGFARRLQITRYGDVLIAAQAMDLGLPAAEFIIATVNVGHLALFVPAALWANITP